MLISAGGWGSGAWALRALEQDGSVAWQYDPHIASGATPPTLGPDGTVYLSWDLRYFGAVESRGEERWSIYDDRAAFRKRPTVSPDGSVVIGAGGGFGIDGLVRAFDTNDGTELWATTLTLPFAGSVYTSGQPTFSRDGNVLYLGSSVFSGSTDGSFLFALAAASTSSSCVADTNSDGMLSPADFSAWVAAFNDNTPACDQNGDGVCTPADFSAWVANYNAGC